MALNLKTVGWTKRTFWPDVKMSLGLGLCKLKDLDWLTYSTEDAIILKMSWLDFQTVDRIWA